MERSICGAAVLAALLLAGMAPASRAADLTRLLSRDAGLPLDVKVVGSEKRAVLRDLQPDAVPERGRGAQLGLPGW